MDAEYTDQPIKQSMSRFKQFGWNGASRYHEPIPNLNRYLKSKIGQKWDAIYSELCKKCHGQYSRSQLDNSLWVKYNCTEENGVFYDSQGIEVGAGFVIVDGILKYSDNRYYKRDNMTKEERRLKYYNTIIINDEIYTIRKGLWYKLNMVEIQKSDIGRYCRIEDCHIGSFSGRWARKNAYDNENIRCVGYKQLNRKELKQLKIELEKLDKFKEENNSNGK